MGSNRSIVAGLAAAVSVALAVALFLAARTWVINALAVLLLVVAGFWAWRATGKPFHKPWARL